MQYKYGELLKYIITVREENAILKDSLSFLEAQNNKNNGSVCVNESEENIECNTDTQ